MGNRDAPTPLVATALRAFGIDDPRATLDDIPWAHETAVFQALDRRFRVRTTDLLLGHHVEDMFAAMRIDPDDPTAQTDCYSMFAVTHDHTAIYRDDDELYWSSRPAIVLERLIWDVNQHAIRSQDRWVKLHAGVVDRDGVGVVLAAPMESGKSTLTAGLVLRGYRYLSDEVAAIRVGDGRVDAYPKPLGLDPGSWPLLPEFAPDREGLEKYSVNQWQVPPRRFPGGTATETTPHVVVLPTYDRGGGTKLIALASAAVATAALSTCAFTGQQARAGSLQVLARVASSAACYRLQHDDLAAACEAIDEVVSGVASERLA